MSLSINPSGQEPNDEAQNHLNSENENQAEWDNDTYGHSPDTSAFKRKNEPDQKHLEHLKDISDDSNINSSARLKNRNLSDEDLSGSSVDNEKGLGGKQL